MRQCPNRVRTAAGFSLVELMTATAVATLLMLILAGVSSQVSRLLTIGLGQNQNRSSARTAIAIMSRELRQAVISRQKLLPETATTPTQSVLQLVINPADDKVPVVLKNPDAIFWQAPIATVTTSGDLAEVGYFVYRQTLNNVRHSDLCRFFINPDNSSTSNYAIYKSPYNIWLTPDLLEMFKPNINNKFNGLFLENVIGLWAKVYGPDGKLSSQQVASTHVFDSRTNLNSSGVDSLPPMIQIGMVLMSSTSIKRLTSDINVSGYNTADECMTFLKGQAASSKYWAGILAGTDVIYFNVILDNYSP